MRPETKIIRAIRWRRIVDEQLASGLSQRAWCEANNISRNSFKNWKSKVINYTLDQLYKKAESFGLTCSPESHRSSVCRGDNSTSPFAELPMETPSSSADIIEPPQTSLPGIEISCGRFTIHFNNEYVNEQTLTAVLKAVSHAD